MKVSLIVTFRNEMSHLEEWWESLEAQTRLPDEVVIVDGGSDDGTWEYLQSVKPPFTLRLESYPGSNISAGRNRAVRLAAYDVIAVTDGGCVLRPDWLAELVEPLESDGSLQVVAGAYQPLPVDFFQRVSACVTLPRLEEIDPARFLPSARSTAYRRGVWEAAGGYPEWLAFGEDMYFNHTWRRMGINYTVKKEAVVYWRMRPGPASFFRQYYRYAWGDGRSGMYPRRHLIRYAVYAWGAGRRSPAGQEVVVLGGDPARGRGLRRPQLAAHPRLLRGAPGAGAGRRRSRRPRPHLLHGPGQDGGLPRGHPGQVAGGPGRGRRERPEGEPA